MSTLLSWFKRLIFPPICLLCREEPIQDHDSLCEKCTMACHRNNAPLCVSCGGTNDGLLEVCSQCSGLKRHWDYGFSVWKFKDGGRDFVHALKYKGRVEVVKFIATEMQRCLSQNHNIDYDLITFVPLHYFKKMLRGFNQSELIAKRLSLLLNLPCKKVVNRVKFARQQAMLSREERQKNIRNIFEMRKGMASTVRGKHILLVDDVLTTGSTFNEVAKQLKKSGAASITIISIARG